MELDKELDNIFNKSSNKKLHLTEDEARLVDWLITCHSWDYDLFSRLNSPDMLELRKEIGQILLNKKNYIELGKEDFSWLMTCTPITFRWGYSEDVGKSLKTKLYGLLIDGTDHHEKAEQKQTEKEKETERHNQTTQNYDE